jgi:hypothetical protein
MNKQEIMERVDAYAAAKEGHGVGFTTGEELEFLRAAIEAALPDDGWNHAGHFYNLVMHALMDVGANHGWAKVRLNDILEQLEALKKISPTTALPDVPTVPELIDIDDLKDRLVAISEAVAYQDDRAAQAILGELLRLLSAAPEPAQAEQPTTVEALTDLYLSLTEAMGYQSGKDGLEWSPEEWAKHLFDSYKAQAEQPYTQYPYEAAISWSGFNVFGNDASINAVKTAIYEAGMVPELRERIKQAEQPRNEPVQQPVAWRDPKNHDPGQGCTYSSNIANKWPHIYSQPLYASPQAQPMSDEQRRLLIDSAGARTEGLDQDDFAQEIVFEVERFHKIGG